MQKIIIEIEFKEGGLYLTTKAVPGLKRLSGIYKDFEDGKTTEAEFQEEYEQNILFKKIVDMIDEEDDE